MLALKYLLMLIGLGLVVHYRREDRHQTVTHEDVADGL